MVIIKRNWHQESLKDLDIKEYLSYILSYKEEQVRYYKRHQSKNRLYSMCLLSPAVVLFGASIVTTMIPDDIACLSSLTKHKYQWSYIFLLLTTFLFLTDRLFGKSNAWVRFTLARQEIEEVASEYHSQWLKLLPKLKAETIDNKARNETIDLLEKFDLKLKKVVKAETENWKSYFSTQLKEFSKKANNIIKGN